MTLEEFKAHARRLAEVTPGLMHAKNIMRLLAIIDAMEGELGKAELHKTEHANGCFDMRCWDCKQYAKPEGFGGLASIRERFERGEFNAE